MSVDKQFLAPCGLFCGVCGVYFATRDNNTRFMDKLIAMYSEKIPGLEKLKREDFECEGCLSNRVSIFCRACAIKSCTRAKDLEGCHQCGEWPCKHIDKFPMPVGRKVIRRAIPYWREHGTKKYVADEKARYICPGCGHEIFRGAKRCNKCKEPVDLD